MMALTSPILAIIFVRNYFNYKSEVNQKILALQKDTDTDAVITMQNKVELLVERVIVLEKLWPMVSLICDRKVASSSDVELQ